MMAQAARFIQLCNARIMDLRNRLICTADDRYRIEIGGVPPSPIDTGCVVCVRVKFDPLMKSLRMSNRRRLKPCVSKQDRCQERRFSDLRQAELAIDKIFVKTCSKCNGATNCVADATTDNGDQAMNIVSERFVYLNNGVCVSQRGTYYGSRFVPTDNGGSLKWFSCLGDKPKQLTARVCCLLSALNTLNEDAEGVIRGISVATTQRSDAIPGPLGSKCMRASQLEENGPVLVFLNV